MPLTADELNRRIAFAPGGFVPFRPAHLHLIGESEDAALMMVAQAGAGEAFSLVAGGRIVACFGVVPPWPGMAEAWLATGPGLKPYAAPFTYAARQFIHIAALSLGLRRVQIHVHTANVPHVKWARAARFKVEAELLNYLPDGGSVLLMARLFGGGR